MSCRATPELDRVLARTGIAIFEDLDGREAHRRGHLLAIDTQVRERRVAARREVHAAAVHDLLEAGARDRELEQRFRELLAELGRRLPGVAAMGLLEPAAEPGLPFPARLVHAVVHDAAEGVERIDRAPLAGGRMRNA